MELTTIRAAAIAVAFGIFGASTALYVERSGFAIAPGADAQAGGVVRHYDLTIKPSEIDMGGPTWHAWTFNGSVPGPTLIATVGDVIEVTVTNMHTMVHSFHTHLSPYALESDVSQLNTITGIGGMAMIAPGESYTYKFVANEAGLYYYHCHSAAGGKPISAHIAQGLYGAIIVKGREEAPIRDEVVFMAERGFNVSDNGAPFFLMNGKGLPGGEHHLEEIFAEGGLAAVTPHFGHTIPAISAKVGEPVRVNVINIGDQIHSFHIHAMTAYDVEDARPVPAQVVGLVPGEVDRFVVTPNQAGAWLFHCHVVSHADAGMIGVFLVEPA